MRDSAANGASARGGKRRRPFARLALANIKSQHRLYVPYIMAAAGCSAMFYILMFLLCGDGLLKIKSTSLPFVLTLGAVVVGLFSAIILVYANSFVMKQRKREFGLYSVLGMERRHISRILFIETLVADFAALVAGLGVGILLSKLVLLFFAKAIRIGIPFGFEIPPFAIAATLLLFGAIFLLTFIINATRIRLTGTLALINSASVGEKEPKSKWLLTIIGVIALIGGYGMAVFITNPAYALVFFFFAVILVIIATYCLFTAGSVTLLKRLKRTPSFYYKAKNFISTSGLLYRMKQNAAGLANICILSTMVLVMVSTTTCLYAGMEDALRNQYPRDISVTGIGFTTEEQYQTTKQELVRTVAESQTSSSNLICYRYIENTVKMEGNALITDHTDSIMGISDRKEAFVMPLADYNALNGTAYTLENGRAFVALSNGEYAFDTINMWGYTLEVEGNVAVPQVEEYYSAYGYKPIYVIVSDIDTLKAVYAARILHAEPNYVGAYNVFFGVDAAQSDEEALGTQITEAVRALLEEPCMGSEEDGGAHMYVREVSNARTDFLGTYGGLFFLGMMLGVVFIMGCVLIMYYKQISEGYEDRARYAIMRKVGLSRQEVKRSIRSQVLLVFFLPLGVAFIHLLFAFPMITRLFKILSLTNVSLFFICTASAFVVFALLYYVVYTLTARTYMKIVCF